LAAVICAFIFLTHSWPLPVQSWPLPPPVWSWQPLPFPLGPLSLKPLCLWLP